MRPIDLQDNLSKAPLASREQQIQQSSPDQAQRNGAMRLADERALDQARPVPTEESGGPENRVDRDADQGNLQQQARRDQTSRQEGDDDEPSTGTGASPNSRDIDVVA
ncbi:MAG: hypothetical protein CME24_07855 [Gemmatimonadetes bacterium]|jgi:hypothetical protein|nr:hypothetical protein [Gemmatimonadota bacterium]